MRVGYTGLQAAEFMRAAGTSVTIARVEAPDYQPGALVSIVPEPGSVISSQTAIKLAVAK